MEYYQDSFLAGIAVGRRIKGWASGGDLSIGISESAGTTDKYLTIASFAPIKSSISTIPVEASLRLLITDYKEA